MRQPQPGLLDTSASVHLRPRAPKAAPPSTAHPAKRATDATPELLATLGFTQPETLARPVAALAAREDLGRVHAPPAPRGRARTQPVGAERSPGLARRILGAGASFVRHPAARHAAFTRLLRKLRALPAIIRRRPQFDAPIHFTGAPLTTVLPPQTQGTKNFIAAYEASRAARTRAIASARGAREMLTVRSGAAPKLRVPVPMIAFEPRVLRVDPHPLLRGLRRLLAIAAALGVATGAVYGYGRLAASNARGDAAAKQAAGAARRADDAAARIAELERQSARLHRSLASLEAEDARLRGIIARRVAAPTPAPEALAQLPRPVREPAVPQTPARSPVTAPNTTGKLAYVPSLDPSGGGVVTSSYGWRTSPWPEFHRGLDLAQPMGHPVLAAADGVVEEAGWNGGFGKLVDIDHGNGYHTYYGHLSRIDVTVGQRVRRGETIAGVGMTGQATGPHLHYQIMLRGSPIDPTPYLHGVPISVR